MARRVLGDDVLITISMRQNYAMMLYRDDGATIGDLHEALKTLEDTEQTARRVLGGAHPTAMSIEGSLREARDALRRLRAREDA